MRPRYHPLPMSESPEQRGVVSLDEMRRVSSGMSPAQVVAILGEPFRRLCPEEVKIPSEVFAELGSSFQFASDQKLTEVWSYAHDRRGKFKLKDRVTSFLAFKDGVLRCTWRSYEQAAEEKPARPGGAGG